MAGHAALVRDHVTLTCRSVDRIFLQAYVPRLQSVGPCGGRRPGRRGWRDRGAQAVMVPSSGFG